ALAKRYLGLLSDAQRRIVTPIFEAWEKIDWRTLPAGVIHGDANDYNILVDESGSRVTSILDLGDMTHTATVCDLAIALAYVMLDKQDPIAAARSVGGADHERRPLSPAEIDGLVTLAAAGLAM